MLTVIGFGTAQPELPILLPVGVAVVATGARLREVRRPILLFLNKLFTVELSFRLLRLLHQHRLRPTTTIVVVVVYVVLTVLRRYRRAVTVHSGHRAQLVRTAEAVRLAVGVVGEDGGVALAHRRR